MLNSNAVDILKSHKDKSFLMILYKQKNMNVIFVWNNYR